jgi:hypothetical protein
MGYWTGSGVDSKSYTENVICYNCNSDHEANYQTEGGSVDYQWKCECGYENSEELGGD